MDLLFEWNEAKAQRNLRKHGVSFEEGKTVFNDRFAITVADPVHSAEEDRWIDIGFSSQGRLLVVWYTERGERIRLIGCRRAKPAEQRHYRDERSD